MAPTLLAGMVTLAVAIVGAFLSYSSTRRLAQLQARLARVNSQLSELYGPMLATSEANRIAYRSFLSAYRPGLTRGFLATNPTEDELRIWRLWITHVLQPGNERLRELVTTKAHLLIDDRMPDVLLQLCAHTAGYVTTVRRWEAGDYTVHGAVVPHPQEALSQYLESSFARLKREQAELLARTEPTRL